MGQALLPEHFYAQEQGLREEFSLRFRTQRLPAWGLGSLQWDSFQLLKGIVSIQEMTLVLQSGTLIDIPGNTAPAHLNLNAAGVSRAPVFVHLESGYDVVSAGRGDELEEGIERIVQRISLSTDPYSETAAEVFKLAELECGPDGLWGVSSGYVPPLLQVETSPFMATRVETMKGLVRTLRQVLGNEIRDNYLSAEGLTSAKQCLRGLFEFQALLQDLEHGVHHHPYELFAALRSLYIDVCVYRDVTPSEIERGYSHSDLAGCFSALLDRVAELAESEGRRLPYREFTRKEGMLVCELDAEMRRARDIFLLIQKPAVSATVDFGRIKLASESRLHVVYEKALRGIPISRMEKPPFHHGLAPTVEFHSISPGVEWDHAVREGRVVMFDGPHLDGCRCYLYWRNG